MCVTVHVQYTTCVCSIHARTQCANTQTHKHTHAHIHTQTHRRKHAHTNTFMYAHTPAETRTCTRPCTRIHTDYTHTRTPTHTYTGQPKEKNTTRGLRRPYPFSERFEHNLDMKRNEKKHGTTAFNTPRHDPIHLHLRLLNLSGDCPRE